ncbi:hypothetical protein GDO81_009285 [Engystomops pustulosus]|uniref:Uncharacterized protein n=1 Tax=Engystomops pustulosus TaxID=76066 RepID=A0AAV7BQS1_ENGPU|nr:hypothetical protein GDO81_009285 [Engystomops pustulosus]
MTLLGATIRASPCALRSHFSEHENNTLPEGQHYIREETRCRRPNVQFCPRPLGFPEEYSYNIQFLPRIFIQYLYSLEQVIG